MAFIKTNYYQNTAIKTPSPLAVQMRLVGICAYYAHTHIFL